MANYNNYQEKPNPIYNVIYYVVLVLLIVAIALMVFRFRSRREAYKLAIEETAMSDSFRDIALEKEREKAIEKQNAIKSAAMATTTPEPTYYPN
jgi:flagellar biosynthesis/type III secretory pathway M-ring protein FliF/YscJ